MNIKYRIIISRASVLAVSMIFALTASSLSTAQERTSGYGDWETSMEIIYPDGTYGGLIREKFLTEAECLRTRNGHVQAAQASFEGIDQQYEPHDGPWKAMEAKANMAPCRNIATGQVSSRNVPGGFAGQRYPSVDVCMQRGEKCSDSGGPYGSGGSTQAAEVQRRFNQLANADSTDVQAEVAGAAIAEAYGGSAAEQAAVTGLMKGIFGALNRAEKKNQQSAPAATPRNGQVTRTYPDGSKYVGQWADNQPNGQGTFIWPDGHKYVGQMVKNKQHGQGTMKYPDGSSFEGQWVDANPYGQGTFTRPNGQKYVGQWADNQPNGQGTYTWPSGQKYVGHFRNSKPDGQGTMTLADGSKYVGQYVDGQKSGQGTFTWPDGDTYVGQFRDDKENGQGTYTLADGSKYVGQYVDNKRDGQGTMTWPDGSKYVGQFGDDTFNGQATYTLADGSKYVGQYVDGQKSGQGTFTWPDGRVESGRWEDGELVEPE